MITFEETLDKMLENPLINEMTYKYRNSVELSGWIIRKPKFITNDKTGVESASLLLFQINNAGGRIRIESFNCITYVRDLIEQLKKQDKVLFIVSVAKLRHHFKRGDYAQIVEMQTMGELEIPFADEYLKKEVK